MSKWERARLGDVFLSIKNGANIKQGSHVGDGYPITRIETISDGRIDRTKMGYAGIDSIDSYQNNVLESGDILMSHINSIKHLGKTALYEKENNETIIHGMNLLRLKPNRQILESKYARYYFDTLVFKRQIPRITKNSVNQSSFNVKALQELTIPLPSLDVQLKIADLLDRASAIIKIRKVQIDKLDLIVKSQFVEMFGDPVTNPKGWLSTPLNELGDWSSGGTPPRSEVEYFNGDIDWYSAGELNELVLKGSIEKITLDAIRNTSAKLFQPMSLFVGMYDSAAFKLGITPFAASSNQACANIAPFPHKTNVYWLYFVLQIMRPYFLGQRRGIRQKNLNLGMIKSFMIPLPPLSMQDNFSDYVQRVEAQKSLLQLSLDKLELNYKSLMQKCIAGEVF